MGKTMHMACLWQYQQLPIVGFALGGHCGSHLSFSLTELLPWWAVLACQSGVNMQTLSWKPGLYKQNYVYLLLIAVSTASNCGVCSRWSLWVSSVISWSELLLPWAFLACQSGLNMQTLSSKPGLYGQNHAYSLLMAVSTASKCGVCSRWSLWVSSVIFLDRVIATMSSSSLSKWV
jgi:hypothetical protein